MNESNIVVGKRNRNKQNNSSAAVHLESSSKCETDSGEPFFSCLASAITIDRLDGKINRFDDKSNNEDCNNLDLNHKNISKSSDPTSWKQMQKHKDRTQFMIAAEAEFQGLQDRKAWEVVDINEVPNDEKIFPMRWVFVTKKDGDLIKHKARIVLRGDLDKTSYNRDEIYSHTLGLQHFRSLMTYINYKDMETLSFDAVQAFVNAKRDKPVYCYMPEGFQQRGKVLCVYQALYGYRQSPKDWYNCYTNALKSLKFKSATEEKCLWIHESGLLLFFYVDDTILAFDKRFEKTALDIQQRLGDLFPIKLLGEAKSFLGIKIIRDRSKRKMWLVQEKYLERIKVSYNIKLLENSRPHLFQTMI